MKRLVIFVILLLVNGRVFATPTPTPSPTPVPTTPDVRSAWTIEVDVSGTPTPQEVVFAYSADLGDVAINVEIGAIVMSIWIFFLFWLRRRK